MKKQCLQSKLPAALGLAIALPAAMAWYYSTYVNWQPKAYPFAVIAVILGNMLLTLLTLWARGERKAVPLVWKTALSALVFAAALIVPSVLINNVMQLGARPAANAAVPLCAMQLLALFILLLRGWRKELGRAGIAVTAAGLALCTAAAALVLDAGGAQTALRHALYYRRIGGISMPPNPLEKEGWVLDRHDEFDGPALDEALWVPRYFESRRPPGTTDAHYIFRDGCIVLQIPDASVRVSSLQTGAKTFLHGSTHDHDIEENMKYTPRYGYFEIRARTQRGSGIHCAFWGIGTRETDTQNAEIDVFEILGRDNSQVMWSMHGQDDPRLQHNYVNGNIRVDFNPHEGFHIYALEWDPDFIRLYVDNRLTKTFPASPDYPFVFLLGIYEGENWTGELDTGVPYPKEFVIDYFRAYKKA